MNIFKFTIKLMSLILRKRIESVNEKMIAQTYCATCVHNFVASFLLNTVDNSHYLAIWDVSLSISKGKIIPNPEYAKVLLPVQISQGKYRVISMKVNSTKDSCISIIIIGCTRGIIHRFEISMDDNQLIDFIETSVTDSPTRVIFDNISGMLAVCEGQYIVIRSEQLKRVRKFKCLNEPTDLCFITLSTSKRYIFACTENGLIQGWSLVDGEQVVSEPVLSGTSSVSGLSVILSWTDGTESESSLVTGSRDGRLWMFQIRERTTSNLLQLREINTLNIPKQLRTLPGSKGTSGTSTGQPSCNPIAAVYCNFPSGELASMEVPRARLGKLLIATPSLLLAVDVESLTLEGRQNIRGVSGDEEESGVAGVGALAGVSFSSLTTPNRARPRLSLEDSSDLLTVVAVLTPAFGTSAVVVSMSVSLSPTGVPRLPLAPGQSTSGSAGDVSFYHRRELPADSPLLVLLSPRLEASVTHKGASARPRLPTGGAHDWNAPVRDKKTGAVRDMPVTFQSRIRSSGYGQAQSNSARGDRDKPKVRSQSQTRGGAARGRTGTGSEPSTQGLKARSNSLSTAAAVSDDTSTCPYRATAMTCPQLQHKLPTRPSSPPILNITFSPDAHSLAVVMGGSEDRTLACLSLPISKHQGEGAVYQGHSERLAAVKFSSDSSLVLSYSEKQAYLWRSVRGDGPALVINQWRPTAGDSGDKPAEKQVFTGGVTGADFFYSDKFIAIAMRSQVLLYNYLPGGLTTEDIGPRGASVGGRFRQSHLWNLSSSATPSASVSSLSCLNTSTCQVLIAATSDKRILILDGAVGLVAGEIISPHSRPIHSIAIPMRPLSGTGGDIFATVATDGLVALWDLRTSRCHLRFSKHINRSEPVQLEFSPCGRVLAVGSEDGAARQIDVRCGAEVAKLPSHRDVCCAVAYNPLHPQLVTGAYDGDLRFYTAPT